MPSSIYESIVATPERLSHIVPHLCGMSKRMREKSLVMVMRAFFDESAMSSEDGPFMIMAGFVGEIADFERASDAWQERLDESPAIDFFHHKSRECQVRMPSFVKVLRDSRLQGFVVTVPHSQFQHRDSVAAKGMFGSRIYDWAFVYAVTYVLLWAARTRPNEKVDFVFEHRNELNACIEKLYNPLRSEGGGVWESAGSCTPEKNKRVAALQMSDLLAGQSFESIRIRRKSDSILEIEKGRRIYIFNKTINPIIEQNLILQSIGKIMFDSGWQNILASPKDAVDPAVYEKQLEWIKRIDAIVKRNSEALEREMSE